MLDMFIGGFRAPDYGHFKGICMSVALWIVLLVCVLWIALSEMPAGWDGHLPLPYLDCADTAVVDSNIGDCDCRCRTA